MFASRYQSSDPLGLVLVGFDAMVDRVGIGGVNVLSQTYVGQRQVHGLQALLEPLLTLASSHVGRADHLPDVGAVDQGGAAIGMLEPSAS